MANRKRIYLFGAGLVLLLVIAAIIQWGLDPYFSPRLRRLAQEVVVKGSDSLYTLDVGACTVHVLQGSVALDNCRLSMDSSRYARKKQDGTLPTLTAALQFTEVKVTGFSVWKWFTAKKVDCANLILVGARMSLTRHPQAIKSTREGASGELYPLIESSVRSIRVGTILLGDLQVNYDNGVPEKPFQWGFERCDVRLRDVLVDSSTVSDSSRIGYASSLTVAVKNASFLISKGLYRIRLGEMDYDFKDRTASIQSFSLQPLLNSADFYKTVGVQKDRYSIRVPDFHMIGLNISELLQNNFFHIDSVYLDRPAIVITNDKRVRPSGLSKMGKYPNQLLLAVPADILIRKMRVAGGSVAYGETNQKTGKEGLLTFGEVHGQLAHVTNVDAAIADNPYWTADLYAAFLGTSPLHALFTFDLRPGDGRFSLQARVKDLDAAQLNPLTTALAGASIRSFHLDELECSIRGDERQATGSLHLLYRDLKLELLRKETDTSKVRAKPFLSFLVNELAVRSENPSGQKPPIVAGNIVQQRDPQKSFFNLIWKTMFQGIRSIAMKGPLKSRHK